MLTMSDHAPRQFCVYVAVNSRNAVGLCDDAHTLHGRPDIPAGGRSFWACYSFCLSVDVRVKEFSRRLKVLQNLARYMEGRSCTSSFHVQKFLQQSWVLTGLEQDKMASISKPGLIRKSEHRTPQSSQWHQHINIHKLSLSTARFPEVPMISIIIVNDHRQAGWCPDLYLWLLDLQRVADLDTCKNPAKVRSKKLVLICPGSGFHCQRLQTKGSIIWKSRSTAWCKEESKMSHRGGIRAELVAGANGSKYPKWGDNGTGKWQLFFCI